ncbi:MAG: nascent polypeptide-associated complex protein [Nanoarchaeota archaeon]
MFGGIDPKKMQAMMKQMGIKQDEVDASRVVIEKNDGSKIVIENPSVVKVTMQGQQTWQISGEANEEEIGISEEDIRLIMEKTGKDYDGSKSALERNEGDIAQTIIELSSE